MLKEKYLIINADDFGMSPEVNRSVVNLLNKGCISSASLMANGLAFSEAVQLTKQHDLKDIGVHLTLTRDDFHGEEETVNPLLYNTITQAPTLHDIDGNLFYRQDELSQKADNTELLREVKAQIERVSKEIDITHIDNHMHSLIPKMGFRGYKIIFRACRTLDGKACYVRIASSYYNCQPLNYVWGGRKIRPYLSWKMKRLHLLSPDYCFAFPYFALTELSTIEKTRILKSFFRNMRNGVTELYVHPCKVSDNVKSYNPYWKNRNDEYEVLLGINKEKLLHDFNIRMTTFRELLTTGH